MKSGFVGIIGMPNVGKSTFLNAVLGEKIAITTDKNQTTRNTIRGIYTRKDDDGKADFQIVFIDTPGIHKPKNKLGNIMEKAVKNTLREVDLILFLVDGEPKNEKRNEDIINRISQIDTPKILLINKIDTMDPGRFKSLFDYYTDKGIFERVLGISALEGLRTGEVISAVEELLGEGPMYFPEEMITDLPEKFLVSEIIREKALLYLQEEVPHGIAVEIEKFYEEDGLTTIDAVIYCERKTHKGIIIGKDGKKLKGIGKSARIEIENLLGSKVFLSLWVKVRENWRNSDSAIRNFGYRDGN